MKPCRMISIDSSTKKTAFAVFDNGVYIFSDYIHIEIDDMEERFKQMVLQLLDVIVKNKPDIIYIEDTVVPRNVQTQRFLTRLQGAVYGYCVLNDCEFNAIRPTEWRKLVGLDQGGKKRDELKRKAIDLIKEFFKIEVDDDEAEAILIGQAAINRFERLET